MEQVCSDGVEQLRRRRLVVLTFDDAVKSHLTVVSPLLQEYGFGATFFVSHGWMADTENFMSWSDIAKLHAAGFEIGNHSWTHSNFVMPRHAARMAGELGLVNRMLKQQGVPQPVSFAWCSNGFHPESLSRLRSLGYLLARRGMQPEVPYGRVEVGPLYNPGVHDPLLIPTTGDSYPTWTLEHFQRLISRAAPGEIVILQFHGVPDTAHPWVHTPPELFRRYLQHLKSEAVHVVALRDLLPLVQAAPKPDDPAAKTWYPALPPERLEQPQERVATRRERVYWLPVMLQDHRYTEAEAAEVLGVPESEVARQELPRRSPRPSIRPFPGGRHPRAGFLDGALDPHRGSKFSLFLPEGDGYVVVDLPEAVFSGARLIYLAHTHIPTIWDEQNKIIENVDWTRKGETRLAREVVLPDGVVIGSSAAATPDGAQLEWWIRNSGSETLDPLRAQICAMLKAAPGFSTSTNDNKIFHPEYGAAVCSDREPLWLLHTWQTHHRCWGNPPVPCLHADPQLPACPPGSALRLRGALRWYRGNRPHHHLKKLHTQLGPPTPAT